jgi:excisionase family DNA binding protein
MAEPDPPPDDLPEVLNLDETAALLRVRKRVLSDMANRGEIPARKVGREWRFSRPKLHDWLGTEIDAPADRD